MRQLTRTEVARVAALARVELAGDELDQFVPQLAAILAYADAVREVDTSGVPPTSHVLTRQAALRPDVPVPTLDTRDALANAPDPAPGPGLFRVPKVIG